MNSSGFLEMAAPEVKQFCREFDPLNANHVFLAKKYFLTHEGSLKQWSNSLFQTSGNKNLVLWLIENCRNIDYITLGRDPRETLLLFAVEHGIDYLQEALLLRENPKIASFSGGRTQHYSVPALKMGVLSKVGLRLPSFPRLNTNHYRSTYERKDWMTFISQVAEERMGQVAHTAITEVSDDHLSLSFNPHNLEKYECLINFLAQLDHLKIIDLEADFSASGGTGDYKLRIPPHKLPRFLNEGLGLGVFPNSPITMTEHLLGQLRHLPHQRRAVNTLSLALSEANTRYMQRATPAVIAMTEPFPSIVDLLNVPMPDRPAPTPRERIPTTTRAPSETPMLDDLSELDEAEPLDELRRSRQQQSEQNELTLELINTRQVDRQVIARIEGSTLAHRRFRWVPRMPRFSLFRLFRARNSIVPIDPIGRDDVASVGVTQVIRLREIVPLEGGSDAEKLRAVKEKVGEQLKCPFSLESFSVPVIVSSGTTYSFDSVDRYFTDKIRGFGNESRVAVKDMVLSNTNLQYSPHRQLYHRRDPIADQLLEWYKSPESTLEGLWAILRGEDGQFYTNPHIDLYGTIVDGPGEPSEHRWPHNILRSIIRELTREVPMVQESVA
jgi:hypothetical protein